MKTLSPCADLWEQLISLHIKLLWQSFGLLPGLEVKCLPQSLSHSIDLCILYFSSFRPFSCASAFCSSGSWEDCGASFSVTCQTWLRQNGSAPVHSPDSAATNLSLHKRERLRVRWYKACLNVRLFWGQMSLGLGLEGYCDYFFESLELKERLTSMFEGNYDIINPIILMKCYWIEFEYDLKKIWTELFKFVAFLNSIFKHKFNFL